MAHRGLSAGVVLTILTRTWARNAAYSPYPHSITFSALRSILTCLPQIDPARSRGSNEGVEPDPLVGLLARHFEAPPDARSARLASYSRASPRREATPRSGGSRSARTASLTPRSEQRADLHPHEPKAGDVASSEVDPGLGKPGAPRHRAACERVYVVETFWTRDAFG
jgi:hypothetical protein